ncbi:bifunctional [glutamate--ammonia ligase]-adenylyl-L-tyrosine phosphorylase/[glutamate--ammonia-ligase] adenylyltransferase [Blastopirellula marina]|uniref:Bifunctional [glutamate--ammonia ligase]-adenylyl-L-tyrosine phosphorylase/[glutamate--ammonia-ligase] adenylyltransferase n=1 Tax=Blastopirellula marina TaxID=124 RepID=A0A2S8GPG3_9BACT|nr:bifunctional [glutamate--ammonia ligase]-adenylyl-L-tyrosine phosphorylase/[glutamate--ammonia-ligase] adenylyltransferase [Blastopirellula marina]PQO46333.1 bifunctional [glutamate--ammonia ligase]-adenylyl-L-tyrosine phosphorylase/[glutamate--ammonia-ligase] adenylyltransferase [Blastopirellula marina]
MTVSDFTRLADQSQEASKWLTQLKVVDTARGLENLNSFGRLNLPIDLQTFLCRQLAESLPACSDPDMALNNLERLFTRSRSPLSLAALFERDSASLPTLVRIFSTSQNLSDQIITDPESFELVRVTEGQPAARQYVVDEIVTEVNALHEEPAIMKALRRFKRRETLRIAYGDLICNQNIETVTRQISFLADALIEAAFQAACRLVTQRFGKPTLRSSRNGRHGSPRFSVLALGKLGGSELNYSSDIDLMFLYEGEGNTDGEKSITNKEYYERVGQRLMKLLTESTDLGTPYRIDMRLRPEGSRGPLINSLEGALHYYDIMGRTWERQAYVKARACAGDMPLGEDFLQKLEPWIYQRYLSRADITGIKALKRRIEKRATAAGAADANVKTGHGGIRDIEFVIQFLQLLNGGDLPQIRTQNTLEGIRALEEVGCLTLQERTILKDNYSFLRKLEHRLQIMFDLQTHSLPVDPREMNKLALRMGYTDGEEGTALEQFQADFTEKTEINRKILDHLLHDAFPDEEVTAPSVDLVLDPEPTADSIDEVLSDFGFHDPKTAYENLMALTRERVRFLSTRRCRHFLAAIAPQLLEAISHTPDPDSTLVNLSQVSDSLGGKEVLWELFSANPATLHLYVRLCAGSPYLSNVLISNPGMIDELMDSLMLARLPSRRVLEQMVLELCRGAEDIMPILHSFKNLMHLRVGVLDILRKKDLGARLKTLSDVAEVCLHQIVFREYRQLVARFGEPRLPDGTPCDLIILGLGKIGGAEPNYHSDLDIIFLYEGNGHTVLDARSRGGSSTTNQHFFGQLGQRIIKSVNELGPYGRLYELDPRLRPTGKSGAMAVTLEDLYNYHAKGQGELWERQALTKARPIFGSPAGSEAAIQTVRDAITCRPWQPSDADEIRRMRARMEETASQNNIKRGPGGTVDIEFVVQMLQMKHLAESPDILVPNTLDGLKLLHEKGYLSQADHDHFVTAYEFLRMVEARLRLMNTSARHDLPEERLEVAKLAYLLDYADPATLLKECRQMTRDTRRRFDQIFAAAAEG